MVEFFDTVANKSISYYMDKKLVKMFDKLREGRMKNKNEDRVYIVDGRERTGKSSFAFQMAKYINPNFSDIDICLTSEDFLKRIKTAEKGTVVVFDEAFRGLSSKSSRSKVNKAIVEALMEVGQRNLIIFIVLPTLFLLEIYAAVFRSEALFHIYKMKTGERAFKIYNYMKKKLLYLRGRQKYFSYSLPKIIRAKGKFYVRKTAEYPTGVPYETFDMAKYIEKKHKAFTVEVKEEDELNPRAERFYRILNGILKDFIPSQSKLVAWLEQNGVTLAQQTLSTMLGKLREDGKITHYLQHKANSNMGNIGEDDVPAGLQPLQQNAI